MNLLDRLKILIVLSLSRVCENLSKNILLWRIRFRVTVHSEVAIDQFIRSEKIHSSTSFPVWVNSPFHRLPSRPRVQLKIRFDKFQLNYADAMKAFQSSRRKWPSQSVNVPRASKIRIFPI